MLAFREQATLLLILCLELTKVRDRIELTMTKAKSSPYTYKHDSTLQGITHHSQIECCFMQNCGVYLLITKFFFQKVHLIENWEESFFSG